MEDNGWKEYSQYVIRELERLNERVESLSQKMEQVHMDIGMLKLKAGVWGLLGGAIPVVVGLGIVILKTFI